MIVGLFNGDPPYTKQEETDNNIQINVNWKEGTVLLLEARQQLTNGLLTTGNFFTVRVPDAPPSKRDAIGATITRHANRMLKKSRPYLHTMRSTLASVVLHGKGALMWEDQYNPIPFHVGIEDLLIPTDTEVTLENLTHFAVRRRMTPGQLFRKTFAKGDNVDPGWKLDKVKQILNEYKPLQQNPNNHNWAEHPEKMTELWKQNANFYNSDAVPSVWAWDFYHQEEDSAEPCWYRNIILDNDCAPGRIGDSTNPIAFIYDSAKPFAGNLDQLLHIQFGDGNNKPPFLYHSTRGIGHLLYDVCQMQNRLRCQFLQKVFEDMMLLFRVKDPSDRSRLAKIYLGLNYGVMPDGLDFVKNDERYTLDPRLFEMASEGNKQLMGEAASSYKQGLDTSPNKEMTAREFSGRMAQVTKLTGSILSLAYFQREFQDREISRRLTIVNSPDFRVKRFQAACKEDGVPDKWMDSDRWDIEVERVLGAGNPQEEQFVAQGLMGIRPILNPQAQQRVTHKYVFALTHDPKEADFIAPLDAAPHVSDTVHDTELVFGTLMVGTPVTPKPGLNPVEVVSTMLNLMEATTNQINETGGLGTPQQVQGLQNAARYAGNFLQQLAQDKSAKPLVRKFGDQLGRVMNMVKAFAERQQEAASKQSPQMDPAMMAKLQGDMAMVQQKLSAREAQEQQKLQHREIEFRQKHSHQHADNMVDIHNKAMHGTVDAAEKARQAEQAAEESDLAPASA